MLHVDKDIFAAAQAGDRAALERLLSQLRPDIQRYARFQCYASSSIEDVVQEALIVVYRRVGDIRSPAALGAWLVRVVARLCALPVLMFMRSVEELKTIEDSARFAYVPVDQLRMDVARALAALPDKYRQIILLRDLEEMTISEIARPPDHLGRGRQEPSSTRTGRRSTTLDRARHMTASTCRAKRRALSTWLVRGAIGLALLAVAVSTGEPLVAIPALLVALIAFRGCPICWVFGLFERASQGFAPSARKEAP